MNKMRNLGLQPVLRMAQSKAVSLVTFCSLLWFLCSLSRGSSDSHYFRLTLQGPVVTDNGNFIIDCLFEEVSPSLAETDSVFLGSRQ